jgi:hypothetical protein
VERGLVIRRLDEACHLLTGLGVWNQDVSLSIYLRLITKHLGLGPEILRELDLGDTVVSPDGIRC